MRRTLAGLVLAAAVAAATMSPVQAGTYRGGYDVITSVTAELELLGGGTAKVMVAALRGEWTYREPHNTIPAYELERDPHLGLGVTVGGVDGGTTKYVGCISVKTSAGTDGSCSLHPGVTVDFDPLLQKGSITFTVESSIPGWNVTANVLFEGTGDLRHSTEGARYTVAPGSTQIVGAPAPAPAPPPTPALVKPGTMDILAPLMVARDGKVMGGSVRSQVKGGGGISKTKSLVMSEGFQAYAFHNMDNFVCTYNGQARPPRDDCYTT